MRQIDVMIARSVQDASGYLRFSFSTSEDWREGRRLTAWYVGDPRGAASGLREWWDQWLRRHASGNPAPEADLWAISLPGGPPVEIIQLVRAPQCGCCGRLAGIRPIATLTTDQQWRCEKHLGRSPCIFPGCGRTYADRRHESTFICGSHWRRAPKHMRDTVARVRRQARQRGRKIGMQGELWDEALIARYDRLWARTARAAIEPPRIDLAEIEREFGI